MKGINLIQLNENHFIHPTQKYLVFVSPGLFLYCIFNCVLKVLACKDGKAHITSLCVLKCLLNRLTSEDA